MPMVFGQIQRSVGIGIMPLYLLVFAALNIGLLEMAYRQEIAEILMELNKAGLDLHIHCVGERSSRLVLDGVELARKELGDAFRVKVTITHMWIQGTIYIRNPMNLREYKSS